MKCSKRYSFIDINPINMTMAIPLPDIFGKYSKSTLVFPIFIWAYVVFYSKNPYYLLPFGIYTICFLSYICWFEKRFIKKEYLIFTRKFTNFRIQNAKDNLGFTLLYLFWGE